jgi:A/G-specific adenine glycosylase
VCRPAPRCDECPLAGTCRWAVAGLPAPDPAEGSAGVSGRQAPFAGSARQARGRVMARLQSGPAPADELDPEALASLVADRLVTVTHGSAHLALS